jgi:transposase
MPQEELFNGQKIGKADDEDIVVINERCRIQTQAGYRVVMVSALPLGYYPLGDRAGEAYAMVSLVEQGWARQTEVAKAFGCDARTVRRNLRRFETGGLSTLGRLDGCPKGAVRLARSRAKVLNGWKAKGASNREIARRLGISEMAVRKSLGRLGWKDHPLEQPGLPEIDQSANPNLSGFYSPEQAKEVASTHESTEGDALAAPQSANPNLSGFENKRAGQNVPFPCSLDADPTDRSGDRLMACLGLLDDAAPLFGSGAGVKGAGVLLAIPALIQSGIFEIAQEMYGSIGPAFYGLRTILLSFLLMALLRIKRPEGMKEHAPGELGRLLGLDRAPEVKTLRRKLARLAEFGFATEFGRALARRRVSACGEAIGFLYLDGHVRAYHGKRHLPKAHVARRRLAMPATTDYWVNDQQGDPLFVVTTEANRSLVKMLPRILKEARAIIGERRLTVVFDRGGWSPKLFAELVASGFDILTYRKGRCPRLPDRSFSRHEAVLGGSPRSYLLADKGVQLHYGPKNARKHLRLRQVTRLKDGHQTPIITSRTDLAAIEVAFRMFERWRQENFFKYLIEEYALDALVDYGVEPADATRQVPNPERKKINAQLRKAYADLNMIAAKYGLEAFANTENSRRSMRGFKIANATLGRRIQRAFDHVKALKKMRSKMPGKIPVREATPGEIVKLRAERKHLTDLFKMVAYQSESDLAGLIAPHYRRAEDEGRTLIHSILADNGDIAVTGEELRITLQPLSSPHRTTVLRLLCETLNRTQTSFPGTKLHLRFEVKPLPDPTPAFPGPRTVPKPKPDI